MTAALLKFAELEIILEQLQERIDKVYRIMYAQDIKLLTPAIHQYRQNYLQAQQDHVKSIQHQMLEIIDQIDLQEIIPSVYQE